jgi:hypothetical protein
LHALSLAGLAKVLIIIGGVLAGANFIFVNLPQIFILVGFFLIFPSLVYLNERDLRAFRKLGKRKEEG